MAHPTRCLLVVSALSVAALFSPVPVAAQNSAPARDSIAAAMAAYVQAVRSNDAAGIVRAWTNDAVYMATGIPTARGARFDSLVHEIFATMRVTEIVEHTDEILVDGNTAVQRGTYSETLQPQSGAAKVLRGRYMFVWRRQPGGGWKIARGIETDLTEPVAH